MENVQLSLIPQVVPDKVLEQDVESKSKSKCKCKSKSKSKSELNDVFVEFSQTFIKVLRLHQVGFMNLFGVYFSALKELKGDL